LGCVLHLSVRVRALRYGRPPGSSWARCRVSAESPLGFLEDSRRVLRVYVYAHTQRLDETRNIHWRAVPSLREIWEKEKARMNILLETIQRIIFYGIKRLVPKKKSEATVECRKRGRVDDTTTVNLAQTILSDEKKGNSQQKYQALRRPLMGY
jgi:hypothetical protein